MVEDFVTRRKNFARDVRRTIKEDTECRDGFEVVLEALQVVANLLELGKLSELHPRLLKVSNNIGGKEVHPDMSRKHKGIRKQLGVIDKSAQVYEADGELKELHFALKVANKVLGILPSITTLLPDKQTRVPTRDYFYFMVNEGAKMILQAQAKAQVLSEAA